MNVEFEGEACIVSRIVRNVLEYFCSASDKANLQRASRWLKEREIIMEKATYVVGRKEETGHQLKGLIRHPKKVRRGHSRIRRGCSRKRNAWVC